MLRRRRLSFSRIALLAACVFLVFSLVWAGLGDLIRRGVDAVVVPILTRFTHHSASNANEELARKEARIAELEEENAALRRSSTVSGSIAYTRMLSRVLWYDPDPARKAARILLSSANAASVGDIVVAPGDVFVGTLTRVYSRTAEVTFADDPGFQMSVRFGDEVGAARGNGANGMAIQFVPVAASLPEDGTPVRSAGLEPGIPQGLLVGWLAKGASSPADPFAKLSAVSPADFAKFDVVEVLLIHGRTP